MIVKDFIWNSNSVSWSNHEEMIELNLSNIQFATLDQQNKYVYVECGKDLSSKTQFYYFLFDGRRIFGYDKINGLISWLYNERLVEVECEDILTSKLEMKDAIILVISRDQQEKEKLTGFTLDGVLLFEKEPPKGYHFLYFSTVSNKPSVVCAGERDQADKFGRNDWHFKIDTKTGELLKSNLAY